MFFGSTTTVKTTKTTISTNPTMTITRFHISLTRLYQTLKVRIMDLFMALRSIFTDTTQLNHNFTQNKKSILSRGPLFGSRYGLLKPHLGDAGRIIRNTDIILIFQN